MPTIRIKGFDSFLRGLQGGLAEYNSRLKEEYKSEIEEFAGNIASAAVSNLARPNWKLSEAIAASRLKIYENGGSKYTLFQAVEPRESLNPKPGTPAAYAFYQEHGWVVDLNKVRRPRAARILELNRRTGKRFRKRAAYRRQEGKKFFERAAQQYLPALESRIKEIHDRVKLELKQGS